MALTKEEVVKARQVLIAYFQKPDVDVCFGETLLKIKRVVWLAIGKNPCNDWPEIVQGLGLEENNGHLIPNQEYFKNFIEQEPVEISGGNIDYLIEREGAKMQGKAKKILIYRE